MKIIILTEAGRGIGFGHLTRCIALYQAFEEKSIKPKIIINGDSTIGSLLKNIRHKKTNWLKQKNQIFEKLKETDILIVDSYLAGLDFYKTISTKVRVPVYIDDYKRIHYPKGIVVNPSIYGDELKYPKSKEIKYLLGKEYIILRKEFWDIPKKRINKNIKNVLLTFGGINHNRLAENLEKSLREKFNYNVYNIHSQDKFSARQMLIFMLNYDIAISGGGQTTYELARCGMPTIGICFADNQLFNLKYGEKVGYLKFAGWYKDKYLFNKIEIVLKSLDYTARDRINTVGQKSLDGQGNLRLIDKLLQEYESSFSN